MNRLIAVSGIILMVGVLYFSLNKPVTYAATSQVGRGQGYGRQQMIEEKAKILNMSVADLQNALNQGKNFADIAKEKGISLDSMHERMEEFQKKRLQALVDQGSITKGQMQERLEFMEERQQNCGNNVPFIGNGFRGMGMHR